MEEIEKKKTVGFADLAGEHELSGVDFGDTMVVHSDYGGDENCAVMRFVLDGVTYCAIEDPDDGYRSHCNDLFIDVTDPVKNTFAPVRVVGRYVDRNQYDRADILELLDAANGKTILRVGTDSTDDYYPSCVMEWTPESMAVNAA